MSQKRERDCNEMKTKKNPGYQMHKLAKGTRKKKKKKTTSFHTRRTYNINFSYSSSSKFLKNLNSLCLAPTQHLSSPSNSPSLNHSFGKSANPNACPQFRRSNCINPPKCGSVFATQIAPPSGA
jgi:hypothetical protein